MMAVIALRAGSRRRSLAFACAVSLAMLAPIPSQASHVSVRGRVASSETGSGSCDSRSSCRAFLATGCQADNPLYKDDRHPFISVKGVAGLTAKDRTAMLRLDASLYPRATTHRLRLVNIETCDLTQPPENVQGADLKVGEQVLVDIPRGTRWVAVYLLGRGLQDQWKLTFNHLP